MVRGNTACAKTSASGLQSQEGGMVCSFVINGVTHEQAEIVRICQRSRHALAYSSIDKDGTDEQRNSTCLHRSECSLETQFMALSNLFSATG